MRFIALTIFVLLSGCQCPGTLDDGRSVRPRFEVEIHRPENGHKLLREVRPTFVGGAVVFDREGLLTRSPRQNAALPPSSATTSTLPDHSIEFQ